MTVPSRCQCFLETLARRRNVGLTLPPAQYLFSWIPGLEHYGSVQLTQAFSPGSPVGYTSADVAIEQPVTNAACSTLHDLGYALTYFDYADFAFTKELYPSLEQFI